MKHNVTSEIVLQLGLPKRDVITSGNVQPKASQLRTVAAVVSSGQVQ